jgi:hypothetical protein
MASSSSKLEIFGYWVAFSITAPLFALAMWSVMTRGSHYTLCNTVGCRTNVGSAFCWGFLTLLSLSAIVRAKLAARKSQGERIT